MRSQIGKITMDQIFVKRESLNKAIIEEIGAVAEDWGIELIRFELKDIEPPENI